MVDEETLRYAKIVSDYIENNYRKNFREPVEGALKHPFLVPGSNYKHQLWDWDSWLTGAALFALEGEESEAYQKGSVLDFLDHIDDDGRIPIVVQDTPNWLFDIDENYHHNIHKPCLAIHAYEISAHYGSALWLEERFDALLRFLSYYERNQRDPETGLYFWIDDLAIGFDNDPTVFYRPNRSTGAIYLNSLMYMELLSTSKLAKMLGKEEIEREYEERASKLKAAIRSECFDEVDGFFYSADLSLRKVNPDEWLHSGHPRFWHSLPIKITTWAGLLPLWAGIASEEEAKKAVARYQNEEGLFSPFGVRSVAKNERMYGNFDSGNPSCWIGPIWINANYFVYRGLKRYGYDALAEDIAIKTIWLLGKDVEKNGEFHEYYHAETGEGIRGKGFQSWNFLVLPMIKELTERK